MPAQIVGTHIEAIRAVLDPMTVTQRFVLLSHVLGQTCYDMTEGGDVLDKELAADGFVGKAARLMFEAIRGCVEEETLEATKQ